MQIFKFVLFRLVYSIDIFEIQVLCTILILLSTLAIIRLISNKSLWDGQCFYLILYRPAQRKQDWQNGAISNIIGSVTLNCNKMWSFMVVQYLGV